MKAMNKSFFTRLKAIVLIFAIMFASHVSFVSGDAVIGDYWDQAYNVDYYVIVDASDGGVNFRSGAGVEYGKLSSMILNGNILHVTMETTGSNGRPWGYIEWQGQWGWIALSEVSYYDMEAARAEEEARIKAEEEARLKAEEEARAKAAAEAKAKAEEEARIKAEEEAKAKAEEEARIKAEEEAKAKAEEEAKAEKEAQGFEKPETEREENSSRSNLLIVLLLAASLALFVVITILILTRKKNY